MSLKTSGQLITELYKFAKASRINSDVTANIYKKERPLNFAGECIVINSLPVTVDQIQEGVFNLNYFVPNLKNTSVNPVDDTQPNSAKLDAGERVITEVMQEVWTDQGYVFWIMQATQMANDGFKEWYVNFRIKVRNQNFNI